MTKRRRAGSIAVLATLLLAGCAEPDADSVGELVMAPGTTAHLLLNMGAAGDAAELEIRVLDDAGLNVTVPARMHGNGSGSAAGWLGVDVPAGTTEGDHDLVLEVKDGEGTRRVAVTVTVDSTTDPLGQDVVALLDLSFHTRDGTLAATTMEAVDRSPLPRTEDYEPPAQAGPEPVPLSPQQVPPEILWPLINASVGHSLTLELADYYGPEAQEQEQPRDEPLPRTHEIPRYQEVPRAMAEQQGLVTADTREGDAVETPGPFPYVVETLNETTLRVEADLAEGDRITVHTAWPDATHVTTRTGESLTLRTDPPVEESEAFTWNEAWPGATRIASINDTQIVLRHSPAEGSTYTAPQQPDVETTVVALDQETITLSHANPHPLAGVTVFAEVTVVGEEEEEEEAPMPGGGGVPQGP